MQITGGIDGHLYAAANKSVQGRITASQACSSLTDGADSRARNRRGCGASATPCLDMPTTPRNLIYHFSSVSSAIPATWSSIHGQAASVRMASRRPSSHRARQRPQGYLHLHRHLAAMLTSPCSSSTCYVFPFLATSPTSGEDVPRVRGW